MKHERLALELRRARRPFGVLLAAAAVALVTTAIMVTSQRNESPFAHNFRFRAVADDVKGIVPGKNPVRIAGVEVGVISGVALEHGRPVLTLSIRRRYAPVYRDARVRIRPLTAVQDMYAVLWRGHPSAGRLPEGATIPAEQTVSAVDISRVLQTFDAPTRARMHALMVGLGDGTADEGASLRQAFVELAPFLDAVRRLTREFAVRRRIVARGVDRLSELSGEVARRDRELTALVREADATFGASASRAPALDRTLRVLPGTLRRLDTTLATLLDAQAELDPALDRLRPSIGLLAPAVTSIRRLAAESVPASRGLRGASVRLRPLAGALRPAALSLRTAAERLGPQAPALDRLTAEVPPCLDAVRRYLAYGLSVGKFDTPNGGSIGRFEASVGFDSLGIGAGFRRMPSCTDGGR